MSSESVINIVIALKKQGGGDKEAISDLKKLNQTVKEFTGINFGAVTAVGATAMALRTLKQVAQESLAVTKELGNNVETIQLKTGDSAETTSRFIQVVDDERVSFETLEKAMDAAAKKGYDVSVASLARMSDEFRSLKTEQEQSLFLTERFGKQGLDFERVMKLGSAAIYQKMGAVSDSLVMDEEAIAVTVEFQESIDAWNDSLDGVKNKIGKELMPVVGDFALVMADLVEKSNQGEASFIKWEAILAPLAPVIAAVVYSAKALSLAVGADADKLRKQAAEAESTSWAMENYKTTVRQTYDYLDNGLNPSLDAAAERWGSLAMQEEYAANKAQGVLATVQMADKDILSLTQKLMDAYEKEADEKEMATKRIILAYVEQKLAAEGYTDVEMNYIITLAEQWGIYSSTVADQARFIIQQAGLISDALAGIPKEITVSIAMIQSGTVDLNGYSMGSESSTTTTAGGSVFTGYIDPATGKKQYRDPDGSYSYRARGGPVYAGESYIVGELGRPEVFVPSQNGMIIPNDKAFGGGTIINNFYGLSVDEVMRRLQAQGAGRL